jgi:hypothetical protein
MNLILHSALFKGYPIPPTFGAEPPLCDLETTRSKRIDDARSIILEAMRSIGARCTTSEIVEASGGVLYINLVNRHLERMADEKLVKRAGWASIRPQGGQRSRLWRIA